MAGGQTTSAWISGRIAAADKSTVAGDLPYPISRRERSAFTVHSMGIGGTEDVIALQSRSIHPVVRGVDGTANGRGMGEYNRGFTEVVISCALFYKQNSVSRETDFRSGSHFGNITAALNRYYKLLARVEGETLSGWHADGSHAGWLLQTKHPIFIRVPVHLAALFPTSEYLDDLFEVSNVVRTANNSILCISGSNSVKNILDIADDIDFCEYVPFDKESVSQSIVDKASRTDEFICHNIKLNSEKYETNSLPPDAIRTAMDQVDPMSPESATIKLDYIVTMRDSRAYDASTVLIACDNQFKSAGFKATFAHQEVHISASDTVPIELDDVMELGRYVLWLLGQVKKYRDDGNIPKMLKRALSLTRVCWMRQYTEEIERLFAKTTYLIDREITTISALREKLSHHSSEIKWKQVKDDLDYYERIAKIDRQKLEVIQGRNFPAGPDHYAVDIANRILQDCAKHSRGGLKV